MIEAGDQVVSISRYRGRGRASGIQVSGRSQALVWTFLDGRVVGVAWFDTREEAFAAIEPRQ